jgi:hypothetical protein
MKLADRCPRLESEKIAVTYHGYQAAQGGSDGKGQEKDRKDDKELSNAT